MKIAQALLSVSDKAGIVDFARALHQRRIEKLLCPAWRAAGV